MKYDIKDLQKAPEGQKLIQWASNEMPVLNLIRLRFSISKPLSGVTLAACLHVTSETANLMITLVSGGAKVVLCASNPLSTNDAVASALVENHKIPVFAIKGEDNQTYYKHLNQAADYKPNLTMDDGCDLVTLIHQKRTELIKDVVGSCEETTTGVIRLKAMAKARELKIPVLAVNDNQTKHLFDNRYGTGQSTIDGIIRATNVLLAGRSFVICGYGWCGRGVANRARGMGSNVVVCEIDPIKALEAKMDGFLVMPLIKAIVNADIVLTTTGNKYVITEKHFMKAKNRVILAQAGHFDIEINKGALKKLSKKVSQVRPFVEEYDLGNKKIYLLAEGRLVNLAAAEGHPASVMDMSFSGQALAAEYLWRNKGKLKPKVYKLPEKLDRSIASMKLKSQGISIDKLSQEQKKYLTSWREGT
ncbi:adenosylhomocysteinase [Candidatus Roizmanbacteria bacterium RIFCSPHIGHO2_02_FULL_37_13b]|uniref:Adenosylhomocysteinase n=1 Tax=Candidatus Roizmanbacteria bacterium RIFCSPLOWO2_02_FULL_36_11 TaxID=1802071 RepID=A0A1F7JD31_9BACT|nr:MAG: adenosylhomocysteinase [Candidatus Roizmanbacteria bacterium RIFCSPHIGHO2_02_FULL_37_13b]OGK53515.1 MAG: adenosylhomocysteinase [Candidatus Roizmanbacteria bacterium RIFCSPLOWO2_02_FULL_36_11]